MTWLAVMLCSLPVLVAAARLAGIRPWRDAVVVAAATGFLLGLLVEQAWLRWG